MAVIPTFTLASGTYQDEQDLLNELDTFLTTSLPWNKVKTITDTASDKDIVYYNDGDLEYDRHVVRLRAVSNYLEFHSYSVFNTVTDTGSDDLYTTLTRIPTSTTSGTYWFIGNRDCVHVSIEQAGSANPYLGGFGYWKTYYNNTYDPKPFYVYGQTASTSLFSSNRVNSYTPGSFGESTYASATLSGTSNYYVSPHEEDVQYSASQSRTGQPYIFENVFYTSSSSSLKEVRGEIPGIHSIGDNSYTNGQIVTISGINLINGSYFIQKHTAASNVCWAIGRVTNIL